MVDQSASSSIVLTVFVSNNDSYSIFLLTYLKIYKILLLVSKDCLKRSPIILFSLTRLVYAQA